MLCAAGSTGTPPTRAVSAASRHAPSAPPSARPTRPPPRSGCSCTGRHRLLRRRRHPPPRQQADDRGDADRPAGRASATTAWRGASGPTPPGSRMLAVSYCNRDLYSGALQTAPTTPTRCPTARPARRSACWPPRPPSSTCATTTPPAPPSSTATVPARPGPTTAHGRSSAREPRPLGSSATPASSTSKPARRPTTRAPAATGRTRPRRCPSSRPGYIPTSPTSTTSPTTWWRGAT
jgi:hypothetical protein